MRCPPLLLSCLCLTLAATAGCYERVVSEKPFPGMRSTRNDLPTAHDYSKYKSPYEKEKPFDPIGDWILKPIGGVANGIGNAIAPPADAAPPSRPPSNAPPSAGTPVTNASTAPPPKEPAKAP